MDYKSLLELAGKPEKYETDPHEPKFDNELITAVKNKDFETVKNKLSVNQELKKNEKVIEDVSEKEMSLKEITEKTQKRKC